MSIPRIERLALRLRCDVFRSKSVITPLTSTYRLRSFSQAPRQHKQHSRPQRPSQIDASSRRQAANRKEPYEVYEVEGELQPVTDASDLFPKVRVRYLRPAVWALVVSGGIFTGLAYLQAKEELAPKKKQGWLEAPQWTMQTRGPPSPTEVASKWWEQLNPISKLSLELIAANSAVHLSSFVAPHLWNSLWHMPARNVNYTQFSSMFVHSGPFHLFVNMYFIYNFMIPVGYSRAFEGSPNHTLAFFLSTGVLSGFAQHWATLITPLKRGIPEIFIRCGGASGALLGMLSVFCTHYPHAGLGIMFIPVHFEAQYILPAIMLFDLVGMVRGYSFVNFGHAAHLSGAILGVAYSVHDGKNRIWRPLVNFWKQRLQN